jgi:hypothetical protein
LHSEVKVELVVVFVHNALHRLLLLLLSDLAELLLGWSLQPLQVDLFGVQANVAALLWLQFWKLLLAFFASHLLTIVLR